MAISPFTLEYKEKLQKAHYLTFKCNLCEFEHWYLFDIVPFKNTLKAVKEHFKTVHKVDLL